MKKFALIISLFLFISCINQEVHRTVTYKLQDKPEDFTLVQARTNPSDHKPGIRSHHYRAKVVEVYDGDTVTVDIFLGFNTYQKARLRLYGINTPEMRGDEKPEGIKVRDWLRQKVLYKRCIIQTIKKKKNGYDKKGKYGRWLAIIWFEGVNLNKEMLDKGMAKRFMAESFPE